MSQHSYLTIYRKNNHYTMTDEIANIIKSRNDGILNDIKWRFNNPDDVKINSELEKRKSEFISIYHNIYYRQSDNTFWDVIDFTEFPSDFQSLQHHYYISYDRSVDITVADCESIIRACRYLLGHKYDDTTEDAVNSEFISILGEHCAPYVNRNRSKFPSFYIEREDQGLWKFYVDTTAEDYENDEYIKSGEYVLRDLMSICSLYIKLVENAKWHYSDKEPKDEFILKYDM